MLIERRQISKYYTTKILKVCIKIKQTGRDKVYRVILIVNVLVQRISLFNHREMMMTYLITIYP